MRPLNQLHPSKLFISSIHASPSLPSLYWYLENVLLLRTLSLTPLTAHSYLFFRIRTTLLLQEAFPGYSCELSSSLAPKLVYMTF